VCMEKHSTTGHKPQTFAGTRRKNRLAADLYRGRRIYFITITTTARKPVFVTDAMVSGHLEILGRASSDHAFDVVAYCYMPDHVHLLIAGSKSESDLIAFIKAYKQTTGYRYMSGGTPAGKPHKM